MTCNYQGMEYSVGQTSCQGGQLFYCENNGSWQALGYTCPQNMTPKNQGAGSQHTSTRASDVVMNDPTIDTVTTRTHTSDVELGKPNIDTEHRSTPESAPNVEK